MKRDQVEKLRSCDSLKVLQHPMFMDPTKRRRATVETDCSAPEAQLRRLPLRKRPVEDLEDPGYRNLLSYKLPYTKLSIFNKTLKYKKVVQILLQQMLTAMVQFY